VWASHNPLHAHISPSPILPIIQHVVIHTTYNKQDPENLKFKAKRNKRENTEFTEKERVRAEKAIPVTDIRDLKAKVSHGTLSFTI